MQNDIAQLKNKVNTLTDEKTSGEVRLLLKSGDIGRIDGLDGKLYDIGEVDGIIIPALDGREFLIYPKYKDCLLLKDKQIDSWKAKGMTEIESLYAKCDGEQETDDLKAIGSPAAMWVRNVAGHRKFNLPGDVLASIAVVRHLDEINAIAEHIEGADKFTKNSYVWSCSRYYRSSLGWSAYGDTGYVGNGYVNCPSSFCLAVPLVLYKKA